MKKIFSLLMLQLFCLATLSDFSWGLATPSGVHSKISRSQRVKAFTHKPNSFPKNARKNVGSTLTKKTPDFLNKNAVSILSSISLTLFIVATLANFGIISASVYVSSSLLILSLYLCIFSTFKVFFEFCKSKTDKNNVNNKKSSRTSTLQVKAPPIPKRSYLNLTILFIQALLTFGTLICTFIFFNASISVPMGAKLIGISTPILFLVGADIAFHLINIIKIYKYNNLVKKTNKTSSNPIEIKEEGYLGNETQMPQTGDRSAIEIDANSLDNTHHEPQSPSIYVSEEEPSDKTTSPRRDRLKPVFFKILNNTSEFLWNPITQVVSNIIFLSVFTCSVLMIFNIIPIAAPILSYLPYILLSISVLFYLINIPLLLLKTSELNSNKQQPIEDSSDHEDSQLDVNDTIQTTHNYLLNQEYPLAEASSNTEDHILESGSTQESIEASSNTQGDLLESSSIQESINEEYPLSNNYAIQPIDTSSNTQNDIQNRYNHLLNEETTLPIEASSNTQNDIQPIDASSNTQNDIQNRYNHLLNEETTLPIEASSNTQNDIQPIDASSNTQNDILESSSIQESIGDSSEHEDSQLDINNTRQYIRDYSLNEEYLLSNNHSLQTINAYSRYGDNLSGVNYDRPTTHNHSLNEEYLLNDNHSIQTINESSIYRQPIYNYSLNEEHSSSNNYTVQTINTSLEYIQTTYIYPINGGWILSNNYTTEPIAVSSGYEENLPNFNYSRQTTEVHLNQQEGQLENNLIREGPEGEVTDRSSDYRTASRTEVHLNQQEGQLENNLIQEGPEGEVTDPSSDYRTARGSLNDERSHEEIPLSKAKSTTSIRSYRKATGHTIYYGDLDSPDSLSENTDKTISKKNYAFSAITAFQSLLFLTTAIIIFTFHTSFATITLPVIFGTFSFILSVLTIAPVILLGGLLYVKTFQFTEVHIYSDSPQKTFKLMKHNIRALRKIYSRLNADPKFLTQEDQSKIDAKKNNLGKFLKRKQIQRKFIKDLDTLISKLSKDLSNYNEAYQRTLKSLITKESNSKKDLNYYEKIKANDIIDYLNKDYKLLKILIDTNSLYEDLKSYFDLSQSESPQSIKERFENKLLPDSLNRSA